MKTGIELIAIERQEQIEKHHRTIENDVKLNDGGELRRAAIALMRQGGQPDTYEFPDNWDKNIVAKMCQKSYKDRLIIAGALIAAEIDRINTLNL